MAVISEVEVQVQLPPSVLTLLTAPLPGNFSVPVYIRTCHRPSCTTQGTTSPWTNIDLQGSCCEGLLCNKDSISLHQRLGHCPSWGAPPTIIVLLLMATLLASTLGGPLGLSS